MAQEVHPLAGARDRVQLAEPDIHPARRVIAFALHIVLPAFTQPTAEGTGFFQI